MAEPPGVIYYSDMGGKTGPFYVAVKGVRSMFKTSVWAKSFKHYPPEFVAKKRRVWKGVVTWTEVTDEVAPSVEELRSR